MFPYTIRAINAHFKFWEDQITDSYNDPLLEPDVDPQISTTCVCTDWQSEPGWRCGVTPCGPTQRLIHKDCTPLGCAILATPAGCRWNSPVPCTEQGTPPPPPLGALMCTPDECCVPDDLCCSQPVASMDCGLGTPGDPLDCPVGQRIYNYRCGDDANNRVACVVDPECEPVCLGGYYMLHGSPGEATATGVLCQDDELNLPRTSPPLQRDPDSGRVGIQLQAVDDGGCTPLIKCELECKPDFQAQGTICYSSCPAPQQTFSFGPIASGNTHHRVFMFPSGENWECRLTACNICPAGDGNCASPQNLPLTQPTYCDITQASDPVPTFADAIYPLQCPSCGSFGCLAANLCFIPTYTPDLNEWYATFNINSMALNAAEVQCIKRVIKNTDYAYGHVGGMRDRQSAVMHFIRDSGTITKAYLYWHGPSRPNPTARIKLSNARSTGNAPNINPPETFMRTFTGTLIDSSNNNCWSPPTIPFGFSSSNTYFVDVTHFMNNLEPTSGSTDVYDLKLSKFNDPSYRISNFNGASLLIFFNNANNIIDNKKDVWVFHGNDSNIPFDGEFAGWKLSLGDSLSGVDYEGCHAELQLHVSDGQRDGGSHYVDSAIIINNESNNYTIERAGHIFSGLAPANHPVSRWNGSLWDVRSWDITSFMHTSPPPNILKIRSPFLGNGDCISLVVAVVIIDKPGIPQAPFDRAPIDFIKPDPP